MVHGKGIADSPGTWLRALLARTSWKVNLGNSGTWTLRSSPRMPGSPGRADGSSRSSFCASHRMAPMRTHVRTDVQSSEVDADKRRPGDDRLERGGVRIVRKAERSARPRHTGQEGAQSGGALPRLFGAHHGDRHRGEAGAGEPHLDVRRRPEIAPPRLPIGRPHEYPDRV